LYSFDAAPHSWRFPTAIEARLVALTRGYAAVVPAQSASAPASAVTFGLSARRSSGAALRGWAGIGSL